MSELNDALPLLQQDGSDRALHRCTVSRRRMSSVGDQCSQASDDDGSTCYLQYGEMSQTVTVQVTKKLILACGLAFSFMVFEVIGGYFAHSIAIMSDAAHMFSDVFSLVVSVYCMRLIESRSDVNYSFGYHRAETMGALVSILIVCILTGGLVLEAIQRLANPEQINGKLMFIVSVLGIVFNLLLLFTLGHDHHVHLGGGSCGHDHGHGHSHGHSHESGGGKESLSDPNGIRGELGTVHVHSNDEEGDRTVAMNTEDGVAHEHAHGHTHESSCGHDHGSHGHGHGHSHGSHGHAHGSSNSHSNSQENQRLCGHADDHDHGSHGHSHGHHHGHDHDNQNLRGAIIHVIGDLLQSVGVAAAGAVIWYTDGDPKWLWVDPMCTFIFAISVMWVTKTLIVDITRDLMEAVPSNINMELLMEKMKCATGVAGVHDLHVWRIGTGKVMMTAHVDVTNDSSTRQVHADLEDLFKAAGIAHSTVQLCNSSSDIV